MYAEVFGLDVPMTQSQPTESTQGTHRTTSAPRSPNPKMDTAESSAPKRSTVIRFHLPEKRSTRLTPPAPVLTVDKADEMIIQDTLHVSLAEHKSREEQEARENVELVNKHLASKEIEKMMEGSENVIDDSLSPRNDEPNIPGTRLEPRNDKENQDHLAPTYQKQIDFYLYSKPNLLMKFERLQVSQTTCRTSVVLRRDQDDPHDDAHPEGENSAKRQKTSEY
ncbi:hypothetical protein Tco_1579811, partial [Tanacetum coccineum]